MQVERKQPHITAFQMTAQSLQGEIMYANKELSEAMEKIAASAESQAIAEDDLTVSPKDREANIAQLQSVSSPGLRNAGRGLRLC